MKFTDIKWLNAKNRLMIKQRLPCLVLLAILAVTIYGSMSLPVVKADTAGSVGTWAMPATGYITSVTYSISVYYPGSDLWSVFLDGVPVASGDIPGGGAIVPVDLGGLSYVGSSHTLSASDQHGAITYFSAYVTYTPYYLITVNSAYDTPTASAYVSSGGSYAVSVTSPVSGGSGVQYACTGYSIDGGMPVVGTSYTFTNVLAAHTITFNWQTQYQVTYTATGLDSSATGTVVTVDSVAKTYVDLPFTKWVASGASTYFTYLSTVTSSVYGQRFILTASVGSPQIITAPTIISNSYAIEYYLFTIAASADAHSTISPSGSVAVIVGDSKSFSYSANSGYHLTYVYVDGVDVLGGYPSSYTFVNVQAAHNISISSAINTYPITASADANSSITLSGTTYVTLGSSQTYTYSATGSNHISQVLVDGVPISLSSYPSSYTFSNVQTSHTISVFTGSNFYLLTGPYIEDTSTLSGSISVTVTAHYVNGSNINLGVLSQGSPIISLTHQDTLNYFEYNYTVGSTLYSRQYWLDSSEQAFGGSFYVYVKDALTPIGINIFNYKNIEDLRQGGYLIVKSIGTTPSYAIEKKPIDSFGIATFLLQSNTPYDVVVETASGATYDLGIVNMVSSAITLTVPPFAFPQETLLLYQYVHVYAYRNFTAGNIVVQYEDTTSGTSSIEILISDENSTVYFDETFIANTTNVNLFSYSWNFAANETDYNVWVIYTSTSGVNYFKQVLPAQFASASGGGLDLSFLGSIDGVDTAIFIPAFIIIGVACVFNQLTAEVAAFLTSVTAIILVLMGWISISSSMLIVALSLSVLAGVVGARRRFGG